uniref:Translocator protein BipD n=1 Tax=Lygus hesperus TaxID=30085 RepID=A0A0A9Y8S3_LYGHE
MMYFAITAVIVSAIVVSGTNPYLNILETEVEKMKAFVNETGDRINASATFQLQGRMGTSLACWSIQLGNYGQQIDNAIDTYLSEFLNKVKDMLVQTKTMSDEQIQALAAQLYGSNDSVLIQVAEYEKEFNDQANIVYNNLIQLNKITCNSTVTSTAKNP